MAQKKIKEREIGKIGKSTVLEKDLRHQEWEKIIENKKKPDDLFYRNFVFRCGKCISEFKHTAKIGEIEHRIICPECNEEHILRIRPVSRRYNIKFPETIKLVK